MKNRHEVEIGTSYPHACKGWPERRISQSDRIKGRLKFSRDEECLTGLCQQRLDIQCCWRHGPENTVHELSRSWDNLKIRHETPETLLTLLPMLWSNTSPTSPNELKHKAYIAEMLTTISLLKGYVSVPKVMLRFFFFTKPTSWRGRAPLFSANQSKLLNFVRINQVRWIAYTRSCWANRLRTDHFGALQGLLRHIRVPLQWESTASSRGYLWTCLMTAVLEHQCCPVKWRWPRKIDWCKYHYIFWCLKEPPQIDRSLRCQFWYCRGSC